MDIEIRMASESEMQKTSEPPSAEDMLRNMQTMMGQILDRVGTLEKKIEEKADEDDDAGDRLCEGGHAGGRQRSKSPIARGSGITSRPSGMDVAAESGTQRAETDSDNDSVANAFCVQMGDEDSEIESDDDVLSVMEDKYVSCDTVGAAVHEKLAKIAKSCFSTPMDEEKLKEKMKSVVLPSNCTALEPPILNDEVIEKAGGI